MGIDGIDGIEALLDEASAIASDFQVFRRAVRRVSLSSREDRAEADERLICVSLDDDRVISLELAASRAFRLTEYRRYRLVIFALRFESLLLARYGKRRTVRTAAAVWPDLVSARSTLALHASGDIEVVDVPAAANAYRALTELETRVVERAATGDGFKVVGVALGIPTWRVSRALHIAAAKVGARSTVELLTLASNAGTRPLVTHRAARLTPAEQEIVGLVRLGMSNSEIASVRDRSVRTVANQVAAILRKLKVSTRRGLSMLSPAQAGTRGASGSRLDSYYSRSLDKGPIRCALANS